MHISTHPVVQGHKEDHPCFWEEGQHRHQSPAHQIFALSLPEIKNHPYSIISSSSSISKSRHKSRRSNTTNHQYLLFRCINQSPAIFPFPTTQANLLGLLNRLRRHTYVVCQFCVYSFVFYFLKTHPASPTRMIE